MTLLFQPRVIYIEFASRCRSGIVGIGTESTQEKKLLLVTPAGNTHKYFIGILHIR